MPLADKEDSGPKAILEELRSESRIEELHSDDDAFEDVEEGEDGEETAESNTTTVSPRTNTRIPRSKQDLPLYLQASVLRVFPSSETTNTTEAQDKVTAECLPLLANPSSLQVPLNAYGLPHLRREQHASFLLSNLAALPAPYQAMDASRPWLFYWSLAGLAFLGHEVSTYRDRLMSTVRPLQNPTGGFGGGHGQYSHCACSYATILALAVTGGLEVVDRKAMWHWLGTVKQASGGFRMAVGAEEDIRGAYCAMTILTLLNLPLELPPAAPARQAGMTTFLDRLGEWVGKCQTYEGGIGGAPSNEAHGAYAFCALACLSIIDAPDISIPKYLDIHSLTAWLAHRQTTPEGGFQGRQEKLVDACYSHWVGGCWSLLEAALSPPTSRATHPDIWNRTALIRYLLTCAQQPGKKGGMRDKPSTRPDAYHTCYSIAGLSHAQNRYTFDAGAGVVGEVSARMQSGRLTSAFAWMAQTPTTDEMRMYEVEKADLVEAVHPVFVLPMEVVEKTRLQFREGGFA